MEEDVEDSIADADNDAASDLISPVLLATLANAALSATESTPKAAAVLLVLLISLGGGCFVGSSLLFPEDLVGRFALSETAAGLSDRDIAASSAILSISSEVGSRFFFFFFCYSGF